MTIFIIAFCVAEKTVRVELEAPWAKYSPVFEASYVSMACFFGNSLTHSSFFSEFISEHVSRDSFWSFASEIQELYQQSLSVADGLLNQLVLDVAAPVLGVFGFVPSACCCFLFACTCWFSDSIHCR
jgi:hypothetical protein